jgi:hypothetical protein
MPDSPGSKRRIASRRIEPVDIDGRNEKELRTNNQEPGVQRKEQVKEKSALICVICG